MNNKIYLSDRWQFALQSKVKEQDKIKNKKWYDAVVPGSVYHNLINHKLIPDPFYADNELKLKWIAESDWSFKTSFKFTEELKNSNPVCLIFEGLDTVAEVLLNGERLGTPNNMFLKYEFDVTKLLKKKNVLEVNFISPYKYAKELESQFGKLPVALNSERVYIRKAQYSFGWDWGPSFADIGIWKPVYLIQREENGIKNFTFSTINAEESSAAAEIKIIFYKELSSNNKVLVNINGEQSSHDFVINHQNKISIEEVISIKNPKLWWPNGEGEQHLYNLRIMLFDGDYLLDEKIARVGIRTVNLQLEEARENTFRFIVNGKKIFAKGANWIPADSFLTRVDEDKYKTLLTMARNANMNFIRVWGGGIYEQDIFYELCDELGLLVWQDFMFACASYPEFEEFIDNVADEIKQNVYHLQHHPSIAIWCGNNENEWLWYQGQRKSFNEMPGYKIYSDIIPGILKEIDPRRPYWQSSPFSFDEDPNSVTSGNRHQWDLWSRWKDYSEVKFDSSLFITEFGFQGPANQSTFEKVIPAEQRSPQSYLFEFHNKQIEGNERQFKFLSGHLPVKTGWKDFIYLAQLSQGLALKTCIEQWRFNYPHTNGAIIWQLNDCWPVSSWSLIDSDLKPKLSYFFVKNAFKQQTIKFIHADDELLIFLLNNSSQKFEGHFEFAEINFTSGKIRSKKNSLKSGSEKELIYKLKLDEEIQRGEKIFAASLYNQDKELIFRTAYNFPEWKHIYLPEAKIKAKLIKKKNNWFISLRTDKPAVYVSIYDDEIILNDNGLILLPGEEINIPVINNFNPKKVNLKIFSLNDYLGLIK